MKLAAWNVNSLKVRLPHLLDWLARVVPDVVCLQETKCEDAKFPGAEIEAAGYQWTHDGQKTYNGVAILSRTPIANVRRGIPGFDDAQKRLISADIEGVRIYSAYVPNGQSIDSEKYAYKLAWLAALRGHLQEEVGRSARLAVLGDFNIAPEDRDVHDPKAWEGQVLVSEKEREAFRALLAVGLTDSFRLFDQPDETYSWWDYRQAAFRRNMGLRIDHILLTRELAARCAVSSIDREPRKLERPSDHAPVLAELRPA
jgi:exodeoxyribonuclease III